VLLKLTADTAVSVPLTAWAEAVVPPLLKKTLQQLDCATLSPRVPAAAMVSFPAVVWVQLPCYVPQQGFCQTVLRIKGRGM
jgi:hypothetical protein